MRGHIAQVARSVIERRLGLVDWRCRLDGIRMKTQCASKTNLWQLLLLLSLPLVLVFVLWYWGTAFVVALFTKPCNPPAREIVQSTLPLKLKWQYSGEECFWRHPEFRDGKLVGRTDNSLVVLDANRGAALLQHPVGRPGPDIGFPVTGHRLVFTSDLGKQLDMLDLATLEILWSARPGGLLETGIRSAAIDDERVYVMPGVPGSRILALAPQTGETLWDSPRTAGSSGYILVLGEQELWVLVTNTLYGLDLQTGTKQTVLQNKFHAGRTEIFSNRVYSFSTDKVQVQDLASGADLWQFPEPAYSIEQYGGQVILGLHEGLFPPKPPRIVSLEVDTGELQWQHEVPADPIANPVIIEGIGYVLLSNASIVAFEIQTGATLGILETLPAETRGQAGSAGLATDGTNLFFTFGDEQIFAWGPP